MAEDRLLKLSEVAERLRVTRGMVHAMIKRRELPALRVGKLWRVRESDLEAYLSERYTGGADGRGAR